METATLVSLMAESLMAGFFVKQSKALFVDSSWTAPLVRPSLTFRAGSIRRFYSVNGQRDRSLHNQSVFISLSVPICSSHILIGF